jgi:hypothetical protein
LIFLYSNDEIDQEDCLIENQYSREGSRQRTLEFVTLRLDSLAARLVGAANGFVVEQVGKRLFVAHGNLRTVVCRAAFLGKLFHDSNRI